MSKIQIVALGSWSSPFHIDSPFTLKYEEIDHEWKEDLIQLGWDQSVLSKSELKEIRQQTHVMWAEKEINSTLISPKRSSSNDVSTDTHERIVDPLCTPIAQLTMAQNSALLLKQLAEYATVLYFDPSMKVLTPRMAQELIVDDPVTLLHMLIDFWGDREGMYTSGMQVFALPDLKVTGSDPQSATLQATVFSGAAQMICENAQLKVGESFRASESFPWFEIVEWTRRHDSAQDDEETSQNPYGILHLQLN